MLKVYFLEIRNRIVLICFSWILVFFICYHYKETLLFLVVKPLLKISPEVCNYFIATNITEIFSSYVLISFFIGNQLTIYIVFGQVLGFISPALYSYEYKKLRNLVFFSFLLWFLNIVVINSFMFSYVFNFFLSFQNTALNTFTLVHFEVRIFEYLNLYRRMFYFTAFSFQIFLFIFVFLSNLSNKIRFISKYRKVFFFSFFFIATIISPPDIFSQLFLGFSFLFIFEFLIVIIFLVENLNRKYF